MSESDGLLCAYRLDGRGGGVEIGWDGVRSWSPDQGTLWVHLDHTGSAARNWITEESGIDAAVLHNLLGDEIRPRVLGVAESILVTLRGVNLNPGADPEDMVALRMWFEANRIVTVRHRRLMAVQDLREELVRGRGPVGPADFLVRVAAALVSRMAPVVQDLEDRLDRIEEQVVTEGGSSESRDLASVRGSAIALRRYLAPQREAMARLQQESVPWLGEEHRRYLRETAHEVTRFVEDLDSTRERAAVVQDEIGRRLAEETNRTVYVLTVISAILLPPSLIAGVFGVNVGGMPGVDHPLGFAALVGLLAIIGGVEVVLLRRLRWI